MLCVRRLGVLVTSLVQWVLCVRRFIGALCEEVGCFDNVTGTLCAICENGSSLLLDDKSGEIYAVSQTTPEYVVTIGLNCNL